MSVDFHLEPREETPRWIAIGSPIFSIVAALVVGSVVLVLVGANPFATYYQILLAPLLSSSGQVSIFEKLVPLFFTGIAVYLPLKAGLWNIGADGQLYIGAIFATWIALSISASPVVLILLVAFVGALAGGIWGLIPGYLRAKWDVNEIIVSLLMTFIAIQLNEFVIQGPLQAQQGFPASETLPSAAQLPTLPELFGSWSALHVGVLTIPVVAIAAYVIIRHTPLGYDIRLMGSSSEAALQAGKSKMKIYTLTMAVGGMLAGLAGMIEIAGVQNNLQSQFSPGYGFTAIPIALLGRNGVPQLFLASSLFALMFVGSTQASTSIGIDRSILDVIQALIILFLITGEFFQQYQLNFEFAGTATPSETESSQQIVEEVE